MSTLTEMEGAADELSAVELKALLEFIAGQGLLPVVNADQCHGIKYSEWPVRIAEVARWPMDHRTNLASGEVSGRPVVLLPSITAA